MNSAIQQFNELLTRRDQDGRRILRYNIEGDFDTSDFPELQTELIRPLQPPLYFLKLYYYIDRDGRLPPSPVEYRTDRPITAADILYSINALYDTPLRQENVNYYILFDRDYDSLLKEQNPTLRDAMGDFYLQRLVPRQDGYLVDIYD